MVAIKLLDPEPTTHQTTLYAHADVLAKNSPLLQDLVKAALPTTPDQQQQQQPSITLQEPDAKSLNIYLNWLYTGHIQRDYIPVGKR